MLAQLHTLLPDEVLDVLWPVAKYLQLKEVVILHCIFSKYSPVN